MIWLCIVIGRWIRIWTSVWSRVSIRMKMRIRLRNKMWIWSMIIIINRIRIETMLVIRLVKRCGVSLALG